MSDHNPADEKAVAEPMCPHCGSTKLFSKIGRMGGVGGWDAMWIACHGCSAFGPAVRFDGSPLLGERSLFGADHCPAEAEAIAAFTQPAHALRAALARVERAEALVRELRPYVAKYSIVGRVDILLARIAELETEKP